MKGKCAIMVLIVLNTLILLSGCLFIAYCIYFKITFKVINTNIPGAIIGLTVLYFSSRYYKKIFKLKNEIDEQGNNFSWSNFKQIKK